VTCNLLFVYGTLRTGFEAYRVRQTTRVHYISKASVRGQLVDLGRFPGALKPGLRVTREHSYSEPGVHDPVRPERGGVGWQGQSQIMGEVFRLLNVSRGLKLLDDYEGYHPASPDKSLFIRELTEVKLEDGQTVIAWIYWLNRSPKGARRIKSGDYGDRV
jgi:gamma-glutamylcyclotransferase (GGCT)/AIG2-like uncharacterized protein YtfP